MKKAEWNEWIDDKKSLLPSSTPVEDVEPYMNLIELYRRANRDYLCTFPQHASPFIRETNLPTFAQIAITLLLSFSQWVISNYYAAQGLSIPPPSVEEDEEDEQMKGAEERKVGQEDPLLGVVFSLEAVRDICQEVLGVGSVHLSEVSSNGAFSPVDQGKLNAHFFITEHQTLERVEGLRD